MNTGAPGAYRNALAMLGSVIARQGELDRGLDLLEEAEDLARLRNDADEVMRIALHRGRVFQTYAQWERARDTYREGLTAAPKYGMHQRYSWRFHVLAARISFVQGRWSEAEAELAQARDLMAGVGAVLPSLLVATGRFDDAADFFGRPRSRWRSDGTGLLQVPEGPVELAVWQGRYDDARQHCDVGRRLVDGSEECIPEARLCWAGLRAEAVAAHAEPDSRPAAVERATDLLARLHTLHARRPERPDGFGREIALLTAFGEAESLRVTGEPDPDAWQVAVERCVALAMPYPASYARWRQAQALRHHERDRALAAELTAAALADADRLGALALHDAISGVAPRRVPSTTAGVPDPDLTPREREVADLLVRGCTNRQIADALGIAEGTASVHVSNVLRKLGVASRTQAMAILLRRQRDTPE